MTKIPPDDILEGLYKSRTRESEKLKTILELFDLETHQKKLGPDYHRLKTMVKRSIEQNLRNSNFEARNGNYERNAVVKNQETKQRGQRTLGDCWQWEAKGQCSKGEGKSALTRIARLMNSQAKGPKNNGDKSAVAVLKKHEPYDRTGRPVVCSSSSTRQLDCVFQDMEPPKSSSILRKSSDIRKPIRRVKFTKDIARHTEIRDQNPSLGLICPGEPHQRSSNAPEIEDRSQEETEWQEQGARAAAWKLAKSVLKIEEKNKAGILLTFGK